MASPLGFFPASGQPASRLLLFICSLHAHGWWRPHPRPRPFALYPATTSGWQIRDGRIRILARLPDRKWSRWIDAMQLRGVGDANIPRSSGAKGWLIVRMQSIGPSSRPSHPSPRQGNSLLTKCRPNHMVSSSAKQTTETHIRGCSDRGPG